MTPTQARSQAQLAKEERKRQAAEEKARAVAHDYARRKSDSIEQVSEYDRQFLPERFEAEMLLY